MKIDGNKLRELRKERLLSQIDLYKMTGITDTTISLIETGKTDPHDTNIKKIIMALNSEKEGVTLESLKKT